MINCTFENGKETSLRHAVVDALVLKNKEILLVKRAEKLLEGGKWALIGGFVDRDENIYDAIKREVLEETGYEIKDEKLIIIRTNPDRANEDRQNIAFVFACLAGEKIANPDKESSRQQWFPIESLPPKDEIAFDHYDNIMLLKRYLKENTPLPSLNSSVI